MSSNEFRQVMNDFAAFHYRGGTRGKQGRSPLRRLLQPFEAEIDTYLRGQFDGLCAYTEVVIDPDERVDTAWHRPPSNATTITGDISSDHYWWLALDWRNWYLASNQLTSIKGNNFPVQGDRMAVPQLNKPLMPKRRGRLDQGLILDPCEDSPAFWLRFSEDGGVEARRNVLGPLRGDATITSLDLNTESLRESRAAAIRAAMNMAAGTDASGLIDLLADLTSQNAPHRGAITQALLRRLLRLRPGISPGEIQTLGDMCPDEFLNEFVESSYELEDYTPKSRRLVGELAERAFGAMPDETFGSAFDGLLSYLYPNSPERQSPNRETSSESEPATPVAPQPGSGRRAINPKTTISATHRINRIEIENFRAIVHLVLDVNSEPVDLVDVLDFDDDELQEIVTLHGRPWKMLLGENGSGKSSILHAIALALAGAGIEDAMETADLTWDDLLRWKAPHEDERATGRVRLDFSGGARIDLRFDENGHRFHGLGKGAPAVHLNVRGYGAARFPATKRSSTTSKELANRALDSASPTSCNIDNLLDSIVPILNANEWLGRLADPEFNVAAETISDILGESSLVPLDRDAKPDVATTGQRITRAVPDSSDSDAPRKVLVDGEPLSLVSDGYRSVIALGCEIMAGVGGLASQSGGTSDMRDADGIVLIDEIGAHLHPRWRMQITGKLRKAFPNVQFFVTTHEPLCLRGLVEKEVVRVTKYEKHGVLLDEIDRAPGRYRVDQLLTSEFFGLDSAIDPKVDRLFVEYYDLKRKQQPSSADLERIETLEDKINDRALRPVLGYTRRDQLIFEAIDRFLIGDDLETALPQKRKERREEIVTQVAAIWNRFGSGPAP